MPVRPRRRRQAVNALTLSRFLALELGPWHEPESIGSLRRVYEEHHERFGPESWAFQFFEEGVDTRVVEELVPAGAPSGCPNCDT